MRPPATQPGDWHLAYIAAQKSRLAGNQDEERWRACISLANHAELAKSLIPELVAQLGNDNRGIRYAAASVLQKLGPDAKDAVAALMQMLGSDEAHDRQVATMTLGCIGSPARSAIPLLIKQLGSWDAAQRLAAVWALAQIGGHTEPRVVPELVAHLSDPDRGVRQAVAGAIEGLGAGAAKLAIPHLRTQLNATDDVLRMDCAIELARLTHDRAVPVPACINVFRDPTNSVETRVYAARALGQSGSVDAVAPLLQSWPSGTRAIQVAVAQALRDLAVTGDGEARRRADAALALLRTRSETRPNQ